MSGWRVALAWALLSLAVADEGRCSEGDDTCVMAPDLRMIPALDFDDEACQGTAVAASDESSDDSVHVLINGENQGILMKWRAGCARTLATKAMHVLMGRSLDDPTPLYLYDQMGYPVANGGEQQQRERVSKGGNTLYVIVDGEAWIWPGVEVGHRWESEGAVYLTVSMSPKVILVENVLTNDTCDTLIQQGSRHLYRSPEKHYSDDPKFRNYRTSHTASLSGDLAETARRRAERVARLPPNYCEPVQLVRYEPGEWYKEHHDYYHGWKEPEAQSAQKKAFETWRSIAKHCPDPPKGFHEGATGLDIDWKAARFFVDKHEKSSLVSVMDSSWLEWVQSNMNRRSTGLATALFESHPRSPELLTLFLGLWQAQAGPKCAAAAAAARESAERAGVRTLPPVEPNRHTTLFVYLSDDFTGGETVFPRAAGAAGGKQLVARNGSVVADNPADRGGMRECARGLRVVPIRGAGALFYHRKGGTGSKDTKSIHGGCPPMTGVKYGLNAFMWNVRSDKGYRKWQHIMNN